MTRKTMQKNNKSNKHALIEKSNTTMLIVIGVAAAVLSFTIVSTISLSRRLSYQSRVINARTDAEDQLNKNYSALQQLIESYEKFDSTEKSVIGTTETNSKIVLDALPSKYDFPALATSINKIIELTGGISSKNITGSDLEATAEQSSIDPKPIEIPISISGEASYENIQKLVNNLQASIRPFKIKNVTFSGDQQKMNFNISMTTYYMPSKNLEIPLKEIK
jgi:Tfp pilus assembly protein PilO